MPSEDYVSISIIVANNLEFIYEYDFSNFLNCKNGEFETEILRVIDRTLKRGKVWKSLTQKNCHII